MDSKNVIAAIALSSAVIVLYSLFFAPTQEELKRNQVKKGNIQKNSDTPSLDKNETFIKLSRKDALLESKRIKFENNNILGSISLKGATIDDLTFKEYSIALTAMTKLYY